MKVFYIFEIFVYSKFRAFSHEKSQRVCLINITIELMFAGIKNEFEKGQNHIYAQEHQLYYYYNKKLW